MNIGDTIKHKSNWHLSGKITDIDEHYIKYESIITGNINSIHKSNLHNYIII